MDNRKEAPIGVFDSGVGGLTVAKDAKKINDGHGIPIETLASELGVKL